jgi:transcriptional regulator with XRE-family HTH domain
LSPLPSDGDTAPHADAEIPERVLDEAPFSMRQLADEAGISYDAIRSWAADRRTPRTENLEHLAAAIDRRGERLLKIADEIRRAIP